MARSPKPSARYRSLMHHAAKEALFVKDGWFFGIMAGLVLTGSSMGSLLRAWRGWADSSPLLERLFPWTEPLSQWVAPLPVLTSFRATMTVSVVLVLIFFILVAAVVCQTKLL